MVQFGFSFSLLYSPLAEKACWRAGVPGLPWEVSANYIRSGHRSPDDFEPDSLRTIVVSEAEGIKAVIGKPKGSKDAATEVVSFLFDVSKGWTLEKAKEWFERHQKPSGGREHFYAVLPFKVLEKIVDKPLRIRGIALTAGMSRNMNIYLPEELEAFASRLVSAPVYVEHVAASNAVGKVVDAHWDGNSLWYEAEIYDDEIAEKIRKGLIRHVSIGADYERLDFVDGKIPRGLHNAELSLVAVPGVPEANIQIMEKLLEQHAEPIASGEYILGFYQPLEAFMPEHFSTVWLDRENGVLAIMGRPKAEPDTSLVQSIFFAKEKMWDENKIRDWLMLHPAYMATVQKAKAVEKHACKGSGGDGMVSFKNLTERVWSRKYIDALPDSCFAYVEPGEKDEAGRTVPRSKRHLPYKDAEGRVDLPHLRNALARLNQTKLPEEAREKARKVLCAAARKAGLKSDVCGAEESKEAVEADKRESDSPVVASEPTLDEVIASVEAVLHELENAMEGLTAKIEDLETRMKASKNVIGGSLTEGLLVKGSRPMIPVEDVAKMIRNVLPSPMVERSWGLGPQRMCQELRGVLHKLQRMGDGGGANACRR